MRLLMLAVIDMHKPSNKQDQNGKQSKEKGAGDQGEGRGLFCKPQVEQLVMKMAAVGGKRTFSVFYASKKALNGIGEGDHKQKNYCKSVQRGRRIGDPFERQQ